MVDYNPLGDPMSKPEDPSDKKEEDKPQEPVDPQVSVDAANKRAADAEAALEARTKSYEQKVDQFARAVNIRFPGTIIFPCFLIYFLEENVEVVESVYQFDIP